MFSRRSTSRLLDGSARNAFEATSSAVERSSWSLITSLWPPLLPSFSFLSKASLVSDLSDTQERSQSCLSLRNQMVESRPRAASTTRSRPTRSFSLKSRMMRVRSSRAFFSTPLIICWTDFRRFQRQRGDRQRHGRRRGTSGRDEAS
jgi:hypothetical protein